MPQADEKTETYLLTNKGMEKLDLKKEIQPPTEKPPETRGESRRALSKGRETGGLSNRDASPTRDRGGFGMSPDAAVSLNRDKRHSWRTGGPGESHLEGVMNK